MMIHVHGTGDASRPKRRLALVLALAVALALGVAALPHLVGPTSAGGAHSGDQSGDPAGIRVTQLDLANVPSRELTPTATLPTGLSPFISMMAVAGGRVWATSFGGMVAVAPGTNEVTRVTATGAFDLTGQGSNVVRDASARRVVERWDAETGRLDWSVESDEPAGSAIAADEVWVADHHGGTLSIRRLSDGTRTDRVRVGPDGANGPQMPLVSDGTVWVTDYQSHKLVGVDVATHRVTARVPVPESAQFCQKKSDSVGGSVWISDCSSLVTRLDTTTLRASTVDVGSEPGVPLAVAGGAWIPVGGRYVHLTDDLRADRAVSIAGQTAAFEAVAAFDSTWVNVGNSTIVRLPSPADW